MNYKHDDIFSTSSSRVIDDDSGKNFDVEEIYCKLNKNIELFMGTIENDERIDSILDNLKNIYQVMLLISEFDSDNPRINDFPIVLFVDRLINTEYLYVSMSIVSILSFLPLHLLENVVEDDEALEIIVFSLIEETDFSSFVYECMDLCIKLMSISKKAEDFCLSSGFMNVAIKYSNKACIIKLLGKYSEWPNESINTSLLEIFTTGLSSFDELIQLDSFLGYKSLFIRFSISLDPLVSKIPEYLESMNPKLIQNSLSISIMLEYPPNIFKNVLSFLCSPVDIKTTQLASEVLSHFYDYWKDIPSHSLCNIFELSLSISYLYGVSLIFGVSKYFQPGKDPTADGLAYAAYKFYLNDINYYKTFHEKLIEIIQYNYNLFNIIPDDLDSLDIHPDFLDQLAFLQKNRS